MKPKEIVIIFLLSILVTWGSGLIYHPEPGCGSFPDALCKGGWPLVFHRVGGIMGINQWFWLNLVLDFLFWFLVLAAGWWVMKKLKMQKSKLKIWPVSLLAVGLILAGGWFIWNDVRIRKQEEAPQDNKVEAFKWAKYCNQDSDCVIKRYDGVCMKDDVGCFNKDRKPPDFELDQTRPSCRRYLLPAPDICKCVDNECAGAYKESSKWTPKAGLITELQGHLRLAGTAEFNTLVFETNDGKNYGLTGESQKIFELRELYGKYGGIQLKIKGYVEGNVLSVLNYNL